MIDENDDQTTGLLEMNPDGNCSRFSRYSRLCRTRKRKIIVLMCLALLVVTVTSIIVTVLAKPHDTVPLQCGRRNFITEGRIIGGKDAKKMEMPWIAYLHASRWLATKGKITHLTSTCGATVLSQIQLLTAAHCTDIGKDNIRIVVGKINVGGYLGEIEHKLAKVIVHPGYYNTSYDRSDIAILILATAISYDNNVMPACLPNYGLYNNALVGGQKIVMGGWGRTELHGKSSDTLKIVSMDIMSEKECREKFNFTSPSNIFCSSNPDGKGLCHGDSGGPAMLEKDGIYYIIGIATFASRNCSMLNVFTEVEPYLDWIRDNAE